LQDDPDLFYGKYFFFSNSSYNNYSKGFVGSMLNEYRKTEPHVGYQIVKKWRDALCTSDKPYATYYANNWDQCQIPEMAQAVCILFSSSYLFYV
jgi:hypothetical protein